MEKSSVGVQEARAKYSAKGNAIIPNTFQHPNIFVDRLMYYLTPEENVVLTFAVRRILGFQANISSRKDNISLSQFTDGIMAEDGRPLSMGCGLGTETVRKCLAELEKYKILIPTTDKPDPKRGQEYWLQENDLAMDWDGLEERRRVRNDANCRKTQKARKNGVDSGCAVAQQTAVAQHPRGNVAQQSRVLSHSNTKPTETHRNPPLGAQPEKTADAPKALEWELAHGKTVTEQDLLDEKDRKRKDIANLIATGMGIYSIRAYELSYAFMQARDITIHESKVKGQRKAVRELIDQGVSPQNVQDAVYELIADGLTVVDLFSVIDKATHLANRPQVAHTFAQRAMPTFENGRVVTK